ncbi:hypothetical protein CU669_19615 [Paramagnetospirillum kuznetsovii]|uniref:Uncharacterized protein n=1 Tax=Paramagnetospirillum kuznetsovii TaxID=2053833 RepID=A0A364NTF5_9PROT|nr:hypothetical protein [Paramagnetospirillum kuznetsovii]RAU20195.1 hypothetical protein CU669_19615 [Paramagnetospirillum kuznetsovii]
MTERGFREFGVSDQAVASAAKLGMPDARAMIARMAKAHVKTRLGPHIIRHGIFAMLVHDGTVEWIGLGPAEWQRPEMYVEIP